MHKLTIKDITVENKRVFVRVDFNVPLSGNGEVLDDYKIRATLPTLQYLIDNNAYIILASHLGRPDGSVVEELRMDPVAQRLSELLGQNVVKADTVIGDEVENKVNNLQPGELLLLENVRFEPGEENNDPQLASEMARLAQVYVNDAFGTSHRAHASTYGVALHLPAVAGLLMEKEITYLSKVRENPSRPMVAVLGGKKVADKIGVIRSLINQADALLLGGAMANTFLVARGLSPGDSLFEKDKIELARELMEEASKNNIQLLLPRDVAIVQELAENAPSKVVGVEQIPEGWSAVDIGDKTIDVYQEIIDRAGMIVWNGPMGAYELPPFNNGTEMIARAIAESDAESVVGGGDIAAALETLGFSDKVTHLSTGGGAVLDFWEGKDLPGVKILKEPSSVKG